MSAGHRVNILGEGMAARCCEHLLSRGGIPVSVNRTIRNPLPAIMLSNGALELIRDVFGSTQLLRNLPRISKRVVMWGEASAPVSLEHAAGVVSEEALLESLEAPARMQAGESPGWRVLASRPLPEGVVEQRFGSRGATAMAVELREEAEQEACWMESLLDGWLFLLTNSPGSGWLLSAGGDADDMLGRSRLVAKQIEACGERTAPFPASPRMIAPVCGPGWLACGTAAMAFDPICGDGTANAVREAILASAVIRSAMAGGNTEALLRHYEARLKAGFRKHLELCLRFYESGGTGEWWQGEAEAVRAGIAWCDATLSGGTSFRLSGFDLQPVM